MPRPDKSHAFWSKDCIHRSRFQKLVAVLEKLYRVSLLIPSYKLERPADAFIMFKRFCSAPLERIEHPWDVSLQRLGKRSRFSIYMSLFLFRKTLPAIAPDQEVYVKNITKEAPEPNPEFMGFLRREVPKIFRSGWDKNYDRYVKRSTPSVSSCSENGRRDGGSRAWWLQQGGSHDMDPREFFTKICLGEIDLQELFDEHAERSKLSGVSILKEIVTAGKVRLITVPTAFQQCLDPLHKIMYDHLSRFDWLLRGDAKACRFKDFVTKSGEVFVSGDYESATDNLNSNVQKEILRLILQQCVSVPNSVRRFAFSTLSARFALDVDLPEELRQVYNQSNGQMMGYKLSFPLLCLVNFLTFKFTTRHFKKRYPLKINGDDIVFRAPVEVADEWKRGVGMAGLKLSVGKTLVDRSVFTLNSTLFGASQFKVRRIPIIRSKAFFGCHDPTEPLPVLSIAGRYSSAFPGFGQESRTLLRVKFLRYNSGYIKQSRRSLNRGLGLDVPEYVLKGTQLWSRECTYLSLPREERLSAPPKVGAAFVSLPRDYEMRWKYEKHVYSKEEKEKLVEAVVSAAWDPMSKVWNEKVEFDSGGSSIPKNNLRKDARLLKCSVEKHFHGDLPCVGLRRMIADRNVEIFRNYYTRRVRMFQYWAPCRRKSFDSQSESPIPVSPILDLGRGSVWRCEKHFCSFSDEKKVTIFSKSGDSVTTLLQEGAEYDLCRLTHVNPGSKLKVYKNGIGIGPPTSF